MSYLYNVTLPARLDQTLLGVIVVAALATELELGAGAGATETGCEAVAGENQLLELLVGLVLALEVVGGFAVIIE